MCEIDFLARLPRMLCKFAKRSRRILVCKGIFLFSVAVALATDERKVPCETKDQRGLA